MKKILAIGAVLLLAPTLASAQALIRMTATGFEPSEISISVGDTVTFENDDAKAHWPASNIHPTHHLYPGSGIEKCGTSEERTTFDACRGIDPRASYSFTFTFAGTWTFHDHLYPERTGEIRVTGTSTGKLVQPSQSLWDIATHFFSLTYKRIIYALAPSTLQKDLARTSMIKVAQADSADLTNWLEILGPARVMAEMSKEEAATGNDCHEPGHAVGRQSYALFGTKVFQLCSAECHSGCYHGAAEAYFSEHGADDLEKALDTICDSSLNPFFSHQCLHGVGHGLMAWSGYDLFKALKACDALSKQRESCYTGVFMENIVGGLAGASGHASIYLNNDPQYPCSIVPEKYKASCYFLQTSRMMQLFRGDFKKIAHACMQAPMPYRSSCFESMGRDVDGVYAGKPEEAIRACDLATGVFRTLCLTGAIEDTFWDASGADTGFAFCRALSNATDKKMCYGLQFARATQIFTTESEFRSFCAKAEPDYRDRCTATPRADAMPPVR